MYKEVQGYFLNGVGLSSFRLITTDMMIACSWKYPMMLSVCGANAPRLTTQSRSWLSDDNWGNRMAVLPAGTQQSAGAGLYYHADCE